MLVYTSRPLTPVPTASVSYSYATGAAIAGFLPLSGAPMPAALIASAFVCGLAPNSDFTLQTEVHGCDSAAGGRLDAKRR